MKPTLSFTNLVALLQYLWLRCKMYCMKIKNTLKLFMTKDCLKFQWVFISSAFVMCIVCCMRTQITHSFKAQAQMSKHVLMKVFPWVIGRRPSKAATADPSQDLKRPKDPENTRIIHWLLYHLLQPVTQWVRFYLYSILYILTGNENVWLLIFIFILNRRETEGMVMVMVGKESI